MLEINRQTEAAFALYKEMSLRQDQLPNSLQSVLETVKGIDPKNVTIHLNEMVRGAEDGYYYRGCSVLDMIGFITNGSMQTTRRWIAKGGVSMNQEPVLMVTTARNIGMAVMSLHYHTSDIKGGEETGKFKRILGMDRNDIDPELRDKLLEPVMLEFQLLPGQDPATDIAFHQQISIPPMTIDNITPKCLASVRKNLGIDLLDHSPRFLK